MTLHEFEKYVEMVDIWELYTILEQTSRSEFLFILFCFEKPAAGEE